MIQIQKKTDCCGCSACYNICPKNAISMKPDSLGFLYPSVDETKCISCGLCNKVCPLQSKIESTEPTTFYAARHKNTNELETSRSGGVFVALYNWIIDQQGSVYGASFDNDLKVCHGRATSLEECACFKGSKYVQSDLKQVFRQVKKDLLEGKFVLFSGTGCQVAGLKNFVPRGLCDKLFLVDIVCHGAPSPRIWMDYVKYMEHNRKKHIVAFNFRDKSINGWRDHTESMKFEDGTCVASKIYTNLFYTNKTLRECCYECKFSNLNRVGDITIADFWGWEKVDPSFNIDDKGCSLVLINSEKGKTLFENILDNIDFVEAPKDLCMQRNLRIPTPRPRDREFFERCYEKKGFSFIERSYIRKNIVKRITSWIKRNGKKIFKKN